MKHGERHHGFTLLELMVASVVSALTIGGAVSVLSAVRQADARITRDAAERAQASAIADTVAGLLERVIALDSSAVVSLRGSPDGSREMFCVVATGNVSGASHEAILLRWGTHAESTTTWLRAQVVPMSGSAALIERPEGGTLRELCERQDAMVLGDALGSLRVEAQRLGGDATWEDTLDVPAGRMVLRVRCSVGSSAAERVVVLRASTLPGTAADEEGPP